jgi:hypothetical protein
LPAPAFACTDAFVDGSEPNGRLQLARGFLPRALAAFVKRPQAALLKSALALFYKMPVNSGQTNIFVVSFHQGRISF